MPNPHPVQTAEFKINQFKPISELPGEPLAKQPLAVKVGQSIDAWVRSKSQKERIEWLRGVITDAALKEMPMPNVVEATEQPLSQPSSSATVTIDCIYRRRVMEALDWEDYHVHTVYVWTPVQVAKIGRSRMTVHDPLNGTSEREQYPRRTKISLLLERLQAGELIEDVDEFDYCLDYKQHLHGRDGAFDILSPGLDAVLHLSQLKTLVRMRVVGGAVEAVEVPIESVNEVGVVVMDELEHRVGQVIPTVLGRYLLERGEAVHRSTAGAMGDVLYSAGGLVL